MVNGPEDATLSWEAVDWRHHEGNVRRLRQRIFTAAQEGNSTTHLSRPRGLLELLAVKAARAVLRGDRRSNPPVLPDDPGIAGVGGSSRDKVGSVQDCRMGRAR
jgi:RNA-directed DNA polymerase